MTKIRYSYGLNPKKFNRKIRTLKKQKSKKQRDFLAYFFRMNLHKSFVNLNLFRSQHHIFELDWRFNAIFSQHVLLCECHAVKHVPSSKGKMDRYKNYKQCTVRRCQMLDRCDKYMHSQNASTNCFIRLQFIS